MRRRQRSEGALRGLDLVPVAGIPAGDRNHPPFPHRLCRAIRRRGARRSALRGGERGPPLSRHGALAAAVPRQDGYAVRLSARHAVALEPLADDAARERFAQIADYYEARAEALKQGMTPPYKPLPPDRLYLAENEWNARLDAAALAQADAFRRAGGAPTSSMSAPARGAISRPSAPSPAPMFSKR